MEKLVLLDSNSLVNRAFYALPPLTDSKGRVTNAVYGFASMLNRIIKELKPTHMVCAFDRKEPTFRHKKYKDYKGTRKGMPEDLASQMPLLKDLLKEMGIQIIELAGYEADDIIGTLSKKVEFETVIISGDKDNLQLVSDTTQVWYTKRGITDIVEYDLLTMKNEGLTPRYIIEAKGLMGDSSDNIPGVPGVGKKTAEKLLTAYGNLEGVYEHIDEQKGKLKERLIENKDLAFLSRELGIIDTDIPLDFKVEDLKFFYPFKSTVLDMMNELGFKTLVPRFKFEEAVNTVEYSSQTIEVEDEKTLVQLIKKIKLHQLMSIEIGKDIHLAYNDKAEYIIRPANDLLSSGLSYDEILRHLAEVLDSKEIKKITFDYKDLKHKLSGNLNGLYHDLMIKSYVSDGGQVYKDLHALLTFYGFSGDSPALEMILLSDILETKLNDTNTCHIYYDIEMPLIEVLYDMEMSGFNIDRNILEDLSSHFKAEIERLANDIYQFTAQPFNINSSRQLNDVFFNQLHLPAIKKNKTGYSLSADILEQMIDMHPIVELVLNYRKLSKLQSTYIDGLRNQIDSVGKVHTVFKQANTSTGRLSSTEPNLHNIPIRDEVGKEIRKMFVAGKDRTLVCADYSQIELRLLAHMSEDEKLIASYKGGIDIHRLTATEVFNVSPLEVTPNMRRTAKAVNFGIVYGISSFGLSQSIKISVKEAKDYIDKYFETYPKVKFYMDSNVQKAKDLGYVVSLSGRVRNIPELKSPNYNIRSFGERVAMNSPLQGGGADIIKIAMINLHKRMKKAGLKSEMILQIHDELIIDALNSELDMVKTMLVEEMENAVELKVPLIADMATGANWYEAK